MSAFAGIISFTGRPIDRGAEDRAASAITAMRKGRLAVGRLDNAMLLQRTATPGASGKGDALPPTSADGRVLFAAVARLDNREELGDALGLGFAELAQISDAALI